MADLSPREIRFVAAYSVLGNVEGAALEAGYAKSSARKWAYTLMKRPAIKEAIDKFKAELRDDGKMTAERFMAKLETALKEATDAKQFSAVAKILETQGKLWGLLLDRLAVEAVPLDLADAVRRAQHTRPLTDLGPAPQPIDVPHRLVTAPADEVDPLS